MDIIELIHYALDVLIVLFLLIVSTKIYMVVANYIGEKLGVAKFLIYLWRKITKRIN